MQTADLQATPNRAAGRLHVPELAWPEHSCLGSGLPAEAEQELKLAGLHYTHSQVAESHLRRALAIAPGHFAVEIGLYRFYFYKGRLKEALGVARRCLETSATMIGVDLDWRAVRPEDADFDSYEPLPRFYLFCLKAYAYLNMRLGDLGEGSAAAFKLLLLDPKDRLNGSVLVDVHRRQGQPDDDE